MEGRLLEISDSSDEEGYGFIPNLQMMQNRNNTRTSPARTKFTFESTPHAHYLHRNLLRSGKPGHNYIRPDLPGHSRVESGIPRQSFLLPNVLGASDVGPEVHRPSFAGSGISPPSFAEPNILNSDQPERNGENVTHIRDELHSRGMEVAHSIRMCSPDAMSIMDHLNQVVNENPIRVARLAEQIRQRRNEIPCKDASAKNQHDSTEMELLSAKVKSTPSVTNLLSRRDRDIWREIDLARKRRRDMKLEPHTTRNWGLPKRRNVSQNTSSEAEDPQPSTSRAVPGPAPSLRQHITRVLHLEQDADETLLVGAAQHEPGSVDSEKECRRRAAGVVPTPAEMGEAPGLETADSTNASNVNVRHRSPLKRKNVQNTHHVAADPQPSTSRAVPVSSASLMKGIARILYQMQSTNEIVKVRAVQLEPSSVESEEERRGGAASDVHTPAEQKAPDNEQMVVENWGSTTVEQILAAFLNKPIIKNPERPLPQQQPHVKPLEQQQLEQQQLQEQPPVHQQQPQAQPPEQQQTEQQLQNEPLEHQPQPQAQPPEEQQPQPEKHQRQGQPLEQLPQEKQSNSAAKDGNVAAPIEVSPLCLKLNQSLLTLLECPVCLEWMDPPIAQCRRGHLICQVCCTRMLRCPVCRAAFTSVRNRAMEQVAEKLRFPCRYACGALVLLRLRVRHESNCPRRLYSCSMPGCAGSPDSPPMPYAALKEHHLKKHSASIIVEDKGNFNVIPEVNEYRDWIMFSHQQMFHIKFSNDDRNWGIHCSVAFIGPKSNARNYLYKVKLSAKNGVRKHTFMRETHHDLDLNRADSFHVPIEQAKQFKQHNDRNNVLQFAVSIKVNPQAHIENGDATP